MASFALKLLSSVTEPANATASVVAIAGNAGSAVACQPRTSARLLSSGHRSSSTSSTSPVAELRHKDSSRQYPGAQPLSNTTREATSGSAFTTSPVVLFRQSGSLSDADSSIQYPAGQRAFAGARDWPVAAEDQLIAMPSAASTSVVEILCMTILRVLG
jgi:hypothetical protein